jgi:hypothetical protein
LTKPEKTGKIKAPFRAWALPSKSTVAVGFSSPGVRNSGEGTDISYPLRVHGNERGGMQDDVYIFRHDAAFFGRHCASQSGFSDKKEVTVHSLTHCLVTVTSLTR